jgi:hypothetical protein
LDGHSFQNTKRKEKGSGIGIDSQAVQLEAREMDSGLKVNRNLCKQTGSSIVDIGWFLKDWHFNP